MTNVIDEQVIQAAYDKWSPLAKAVVPVALSAPLGVVLGEAVELGMLYNAYWKENRRSNGELLPNFAAIAQKSVLHEAIGTEIYELHAAAAKVQAMYTRAVDGMSDTPMVRAQVVHQELKSTLEFVFDDDEHTVEDDQLAKVTATYPSPTSQDVMALALEAYSGLANEHRALVTDLPGFDANMIEEAISLAGALRARSGEALVADLSSGISDLLDERNRLVTLLMERVQRVRRAARYVFRDYPDVAKNFSSSYERSRRRSNRRRKAAAEASKSGDASN